MWFLGRVPHPEIGFANIFSHSVGCLFTFLLVSFEAQMLLTLMTFPPLFFSCVACVFGAIAKKVLPVCTSFFVLFICF